MKVEVKFMKAINRSHWSWSSLAKLKKPLEGEAKNKLHVCFMLRKCFASSSDGFVCFTNRQGMLSSTDMSQCFLKLRFLRVFLMLNSFSRAINHSPLRSHLTKKERKTAQKISSWCIVNKKETTKCFQDFFPILKSCARAISIRSLKIKTKSERGFVSKREKIISKGNWKLFFFACRARMMNFFGWPWAWNGKSVCARQWENVWKMREFVKL